MYISKCRFREKFGVFIHRHIINKNSHYQVLLKFLTVCICTYSYFINRYHIQIHFLLALLPEWQTTVQIHNRKKYTKINTALIGRILKNFDYSVFGFRRDIKIILYHIFLVFFLQIQNYGNSRYKNME